jgi:hypothetical protein
MHHTRIRSGRDGLNVHVDQLISGFRAQQSSDNRDLHIYAAPQKLKGYVYRLDGIGLEELDGVRL